MTVERSLETGGFVPRADWLEDDAARPTGPTPGSLLILTLLAAALRLYGLTAQSLWVDELLTWLAVRPGHGLEFIEQIRDTIQGPLYMAVVWPLVRWGDPEFMLRVPSALAAIATVPSFGLLAGRFLNRRAATLATLLLALNPFHVWYAQEGRGYAFLMLFAVLTALAYVRLVERPSAGRAVPFALAGAACALSNLSGLFLLAAMGLTFLLVERPRSGGHRWLWLAAVALGTLIVVPWLLRATGIWAVDRVVPGAATGEALRGASTFTWLALPYTLFTFGYGTSLGPSLREWHTPDRMALVRSAWPVLAAGGLPLAAWCLAGLLRGTRGRARLAVWIAVPLVILVLLATRNVKPWNPRYVSVVLPFVLLLAAGGLAWLPARVGRLGGVLLLALTVWSLYGHFADPRYAKADVRAAVAAIEAKDARGRPVLVPSVTAVYDVYRTRPARLLDSYGQAPLASAEEAAAFLDRKLAGVAECWVVWARPWYLDPHGFLLPELAARGRLAMVDEAPGVKVMVWRIRSGVGHGG